MISSGVEANDWREAVEIFCEGRDADAFAPQWGDLEHLADLVEQRRPFIILEYGSGCSTAVFKHYARLYDLNLVALESDPFWHVENRKCLSRLAGRAALLFAPIVNYGGGFGLGYTVSPDARPTFVYIDGPPTLTQFDFNYDALSLRPFPETVVIDGRSAQTNVMHALFHSVYEFDVDEKSFRSTLTLKGSEWATQQDQ